MGIISLEKINHLYWLGRYTERVFTTIKSFEGYYDRMIDQDETAYQDFCRRLNIPDIYGSKEAPYEEGSEEYRRAYAKISSQYDGPNSNIDYSFMHQNEEGNP